MQDQYGAARHSRPSAAGASTTRKISREGHRQSLRKGNILEIDGKLYVVLTAENIHPGKGTPTTQVDMRRI